MAQASIVFVAHDHTWTFPNVSASVVIFSKWMQRQQNHLQPCAKGSGMCLNTIALPKDHESRNRIILPDTIDKYSFQRVLTYLIHELAHKQQHQIIEHALAKDGPHTFPADALSSYATHVESIWSKEQWYSGFFVHTFGANTLTDPEALAKLVRLWNVSNILQIEGLQQMCTFMFACYLHYCLESNVAVQVSLNTESMFQKLQNHSLHEQKKNITDIKYGKCASASSHVYAPISLMYSSLPALPQWL